MKNHSPAEIAEIKEIILLNIEKRERIEIILCQHSCAPVGAQAAKPESNAYIQCWRILALLYTGAQAAKPEVKSARTVELQWFDVFDGDFGIDIVAGSHGYLDDDEGGMAFFVVPSFEAGQGSANYPYLLTDL